MRDYFEVISEEECNQYYRSNLGKTITSSHICTKTRPDGHGACLGDSGGPLVYDSHVVGVLSGGDGTCGESGAPDVYTNVTRYLDFIKKQMNA